MYLKSGKLALIIFLMIMLQKQGQEKYKTQLNHKFKFKSVDFVVYQMVSVAYRCTHILTFTQTLIGEIAITVDILLHCHVKKQTK